ncbi:hypothetical protein BCR35DRAFT_315182 [Leucosporidium creatinivorum]|uniref:ATP12-domain-containing protein n=1 Tax=Leucosporidium creatinivorum TaxID=106004 RepID=A0A1Y2EL14_9BASI|nr:hypothetical protein BCR35DRAFT_315182 [Leucosporidium creatinivorum]
MFRLATRSRALFSPLALRHASTAAAATGAPAAEPQTSRAEKMMRRFWKSVSIEKTPEGGFKVLLDKRTLKTPGGVPLLLPQERLPVAVLIAEEWENQVAVLKPHTLPMTSIMSRALDGLHDAQMRKEVVASLLKYLDTDTVCFHEDFPHQLVAQQDAHWKPLLQWVRDTFNVEVQVYEGILNTRQPDATILKLGSIVAEYDQFKLAAFERAVLASKSYIIALALVEGYFSVDDAAKAAHVEVQSQIDRWGEVEDTHDVDHQDVRLRHRPASNKELLLEPSLFVSTSPFVLSNLSPEPSAIYTTYHPLQQSTSYRPIKAMFGEYTSESPRLPSPWAGHSSSASASPSPLSLPTPSSTPRTPEDSQSLPHVRIRKQPSFEDLLAQGLGEDFEGLSLEKGSICDLTGEADEGIAPEVDQKGHIEYKLKLHANSPHRLAKLVTQLRWRLVQGGGSALYELGVLDNGSLVGLTRKEMDETLDTLRRMLATLGGGEVRISRVFRVGGSAEASAADSSGGDSSDGDGGRRPSFSSLFPSFHVDPAADPNSYGYNPDDETDSSNPKPFRPTHPNPPLSTIVLPIAIKQSPHPERTPEERAFLKRQKRDVRRAKRQEENDWVPPIRHRPPPVHKPRPPPTESTTPAAPDDGKPGLPPKGTKRKPPSAKTLAKLAAMPAECPYKPRVATADGEEKFVIEACVIKSTRSSGSRGRRSSSSEERDGAGSEEDSFAVEESEDDPGLDEDVLDGEGWRFIDFDSLPRVRGGSMTSSG